MIEVQEVNFTQQEDFILLELISLLYVKILLKL